MGRVPWKSSKQALLAMMLLCLFHSIFSNNTAMVVIFTPVVIRLAHAVDVMPSKLLMPLSYATILGGTCTLIGTSTNIVVDGVAQAHGLAPFRCSRSRRPGIIYGVVGVLYLYFIGSRLLPGPGDAVDHPDRSVAAALPHRSPDPARLVADRQDAGGRRADARAAITSSASSATTAPRSRARRADPEGRRPAGDAHQRRRVRRAAQRRCRPSDAAAAAGGRDDQPAQRADDGRHRRPGLELRRPRVAELDLRGTYGTSILAIHRRNENLHANFDQVRLAFGDTLLLEGPDDGLRRLFDRRQLINLTEVTERPFRRNKAWLAIVAVLAVMALSAFEVLPIAGAAFMAVAVVVVAGCLDVQEAYRSVHWPILMLILGMMAVGSAIETTGAGALGGRPSVRVWSARWARSSSCRWSTS